MSKYKFKMGRGADAEILCENNDEVSFVSKVDQKEGC